MTEPKDFVTLDLFGGAPCALVPQVVAGPADNKGLNQIQPLPGAVAPLEFEGIGYRFEDDGVWFSLPSVCTRLELGNPTKVARRIRPEWKKQAKFKTNGGIQTIWMVRWKGFLLACQKSDKPEALPLQEKMAELTGEWFENRIGQVPQAVIESSDRAIVKRDSEESVVAVMRPMFGEFAAQIVQGIVAVLRPELIVDTNDRVQRIEETSGQILVEQRSMSDRLPIQRKDPDVGTIEKHRQCVRQFTNGTCPRCRFTKILDGNGKWAPDAVEFDHWYRRDKNGVRQTWPLCKPCHRAVTDDVSLRDEWSHNWFVYLEYIELVETPLLRGSA